MLYTIGPWLYRMQTIQFILLSCQKRHYQNEVRKNRKNLNTGVPRRNSEW